jgi:hypothetical protein
MESDEQIFVPSNYYPINRDECDFGFNSAPIKVLREHDYISVQSCILLLDRYRPKKRRLPHGLVSLRRRLG